jgi:hypothetical protein
MTEELQDECKIPRFVVAETALDGGVVSIS